MLLWGYFNVPIKGPCVLLMCYSYAENRTTQNLGTKKQMFMDINSSSSSNDNKKNNNINIKKTAKTNFLHVDNEQHRGKRNLCFRSTFILSNLFVTALRACA